VTGGFTGRGVNLTRLRGELHRRVRSSVLAPAATQIPPYMDARGYWQCRNNKAKGNFITSTQLSGSRPWGRISSLTEAVRAGLIARTNQPMPQ